MNFLDIGSLILTSIGIIFFFGGTIGFIRFPDLESKLHALTKADNLGLGFIILALMMKQNSLDSILKLGLIWIAIIVISSSLGYVIGHENKGYKK